MKKLLLVVSIFLYLCSPHKAVAQIPIGIFKSSLNIENRDIDNKYRFNYILPIPVYTSGDEYSSVRGGLGLFMTNFGYRFEYIDTDITEVHRALSGGLGASIGWQAPTGWGAGAAYIYSYNFHYKNKVFDGGEKTKFGEWNSDRLNKYSSAVLASINYRGFGLYGYYSFNSFFNLDYTDDMGNQPFFNYLNPNPYSVGIMISVLPLIEAITGESVF